MTKDNVPGFAGRLRGLRERAGLTQEQLGERARMHKLTVAKLEQGIREPSWATVLALADALGVSCEEFRNGNGGGDAAKRPRGRPRKETTEKAGPGRPRGRPRKEK